MAVGEKEHEGTVVENGGEKNDSAVVLSASGEKKKTKRKGLLSRIWNAIFRVRGDDFEKRLKNISKEEATVRNRMKRRSITRRNFIRNLIAFSVFFEVSLFFFSEIDVIVLCVVKTVSVFVTTGNCSELCNYDNQRGGFGLETEEFQDLANVSFTCCCLSSLFFTRWFLEDV